MGPEIFVDVSFNQEVAIGMADIARTRNAVRQGLSRYILVPSNFPIKRL